MSDVINIDVVARLKQAAMTKAAANPALVKALLAGGAGALVGGGLGSLFTHEHDEAARERARNTAFGAGMATGLAGPRIVDALHAMQHPAQVPA
jgi:alcohol dehydrogenase class IV